MQLLDTQKKADIAAEHRSRLTLSMASTPEEIEEVQRLRYRIFIEGGGLFSLMNPERLDRDEFDLHCDHLIVRDSGTLQVVGTYRLLKPAAARVTGQLYCENEFDLLRLDNVRARMVEAGRACIHPDYRSGAVIMLLWAGLASYLRRHQCDYLIGCASISLADGGANASAVCRQLATGQHSAPAEYRATPHLPFPLQQCASDAPPAIPPLLKGYLRSGAWICGDPAWDPEFHCADLLLLLPLANLDSRYAKRYLTEKAA